MEDSFCCWYVDKNLELSSKLTSHDLLLFPARTDSPSHCSCTCPSSAASSAIWWSAPPPCAFAARTNRKWQRLTFLACLWRRHRSSSALFYSINNNNQRSDGGTHPLLHQVVGRQLVLTEERRRKTRKMSSPPQKLGFILVLAVTNGTIPDYIILIKRLIGYRGQNSVRRSHKQEITHQTLLASCLSGIQSPCRTAFWEYFWFHLRLKQRRSVSNEVSWKREASDDCRHIWATTQNNPITT